METVLGMFVIVGAWVVGYFIGTAIAEWWINR